MRFKRDINVVEKIYGLIGNFMDLVHQLQVEYPQEQALLLARVLAQALLLVRVLAQVPARALLLVSVKLTQNWKFLWFLIGSGRRRRALGFQSSPLMSVVRRRRQVSTGSYIYGFPATYSFNLPLSCCINGGVSSGNSIGGCSYFSID